MKLKWSMALLLITSLGVLAKAPDTRSLEIGECKADRFSKVYLNPTIHGMSFPKTYEFRCDYHCRDNLNGIQVITGVSKIRVHNDSDMNHRVICQGATVRSGKWGPEPGALLTFYAHDTKIAELKAWAMETINFKSPVEQRMINELKVKSVKQASMYLGIVSMNENTDLNVGFYYDTAIELAELAGALQTEGGVALDRVIKKYILDLDRSQVDYGSKEYLLRGFLLSQANWRIPIIIK